MGQSLVRDMTDPKGCVLTLWAVSWLYKGGINDEILEMVAVWPDYVNFDHV